MRLAWRLDALDQWRIKVDERQGALERELQGLVKTDEIADAVAKRMTETQTEALTKGELRLSVTQRRVALGGICLTGVGLVANVAVKFLT